MMVVNIIIDIIKGHNMIVRATNDMQTILTQEPCCPNKSKISFFYPLNNINEVFVSATKLIITMSIIIPNSPIHKSWNHC